ncbi:hypothetical protein SC206_18420 [Rouxiella sp. T17]|uniref:hypothetical protein n=1 Tax=Rouxiella sp. T17 TaxID=3085684 RepID=UPI002FC95AFE
MIDAIPLTIEDVVVHCRALSQSIIEVESPATKESLNFILLEKLEWLSIKLDEAGIMENDYSVQ